jgi:hypothetical protein
MLFSVKKSTQEKSIGEGIWPNKITYFLSKYCFYDRPDQTELFEWIFENSIFFELTYTIIHTIFEGAPKWTDLVRHVHTIDELNYSFLNLFETLFSNLFTVL